MSDCYQFERGEEIKRKNSATEPAAIRYFLDIHFEEKGVFLQFLKKL